VLSLVGVAPENVASDYELSATPVVAAGLAGAGTTARAEILRTIAELDLARFVGFRAPLRERLTEPSRR
jgi:hypothetical protein